MRKKIIAAGLLYLIGLSFCSFIVSNMNTEKKANAIHEETPQEALI